MLSLKSQFYTNESTLTSQAPLHLFGILLRSFHEFLGIDAGQFNIGTPAVRRSKFVDAGRNFFDLERPVWKRIYLFLHTKIS